MRSIWSGHITFGLITIPVKLYTAVSSDRINFDLLHQKDGARIRYRRVCEREGVEVPWDEIVKGYEISAGQYVTFTHDELGELDVETLRVIDIDSFVDLSDIDPIYFDKTYFVAPEEGGTKAYQLLVKTLADQSRVGIAKFAVRQKEHLCALRVKDDMFVLETMHWPAEIRSTDDIEGLDAKVDVREREVEMAKNLVDQLAGPFEPERYRNTFESQLREAAEAKLEGKEVTVAPTQEETEPVADLMQMLQASLDAAKSGRKPKAAAGRRTEKEPAPHGKAWLLDHTREELYEMAQDKEIDGRSSMTKDELVEALCC